jgi:hypothetical protein
VVDEWWPETALPCAECGREVALTEGRGEPAVDTSLFARTHADCISQAIDAERRGSHRDPRRLLIRQMLHRAHAAPHGLLRPLSESEISYLLEPLLDMLEDSEERRDAPLQTWKRPAGSSDLGDDYPLTASQTVAGDGVEMLVLRHRDDIPAANQRWTCGTCNKAVQWVCGAAAADLGTGEVRARMTVWLSGYCRNHASDVRTALEAVAAEERPTMLVVETALRPAHVRGWVARIRKELPDRPAFPRSLARPGPDSAG